MIFLTLKKRYEKEVEDEAQDGVSAEGNLIMRRNIAELPPILQNYLKNSGLAGYEKTRLSRIEWKPAKLRMAPGKNWSPVSCRQINYFHEPGRLVFMQSKILGVISLEAIDEYRRGKGNMVINACGFITVTDAKGKEMDQAELVTILAETILLPLYSLQTYIKWESIDRFTLKGTIEDNGQIASGLFHFDNNGLMSRFETNDRFFSKDGKYTRIKWTAFASDYRLINGFYLPTHFKAVWHLPEGDYEYFTGRIKDIEFN
jgi:hypothetical protein